jgi:hypothetical protein
MLLVMDEASLFTFMYAFIKGGQGAFVTGGQGGRVMCTQGQFKAAIYLGDVECMGEGRKDLSPVEIRP